MTPNTATLIEHSLNLMEQSDIYLTTIMYVARFNAKLVLKNSCSEAKPI